MSRPKGARNKCSNSDVMSVDITTYTNKISDLENQLMLEKARFSDLNARYEEVNKKLLLTRKKLGNVETQLLKKK